MRALGLVVLFLVGAVASLPGCGATVIRCAPVPDSDTCKDLSMPPAEGDAVDAWFDQGETIKLPGERCAYWTKRFGEAPPGSHGLREFARRMRDHECAEAAKPPSPPDAGAD
jgi:hypothetical protein